jgi:cell division protein FtsL
MKQVTIKDLIIFGLVVVILVLAFLLLYIQPMKNQVATNTANISAIINALQGNRQPAQQPQPQKEEKIGK